MSATLSRILLSASFLVDFYLLLMFLSILLSWIGGNMNFQGMTLLRKITDPYLNIFRRVKFLRLGLLDLSPLLGFMLLLFVSSLLKRFSLGAVSIAITLEVLVQTLLYGISSLFSLLAIITLIRIIGLYVKASSVKELWYRLDQFLQPMVLKMVHFFVPKKSVPYGTALAVFLGLTFLTSFGSRMIFIPLRNLIAYIPF